MNCETQVFYENQLAPQLSLCGKTYYSDVHGPRQCAKCHRIWNSDFKAPLSIYFPSLTLCRRGALPHFHPERPTASSSPSFKTTNKEGKCISLTCLSTRSVRRFEKGQSQAKPMYAYHRHQKRKPPEATGLIQMGHWKFLPTSIATDVV